MCVRAKLLQSRLTLYNLWTVVHKAPLSMGFSKQEYWRGFPFPSPGDRLNPGTEPASPVSPILQADSLPLSHQGSPGGLQSRKVFSHHPGGRGLEIKVSAALVSSGASFLACRWLPWCSQGGSLYAGLHIQISCSQEEGGMN